MGRIAKAFSKTANEVNISGLTDAIAYYLSLHPEGVSVSFTTHTIVFTQTTLELPSTYSPPPSSALSVQDYEIISDISEAVTYGAKIATSSAYDGLFTVYDPIGTTYYGAPQSFSTSYTAKNCGFSTAYKIVFFS